MRNGESYFNYLTILILAALVECWVRWWWFRWGSLIVKEHGTLPYRKEQLVHRYCRRAKRRVFAQTAFMGMGIAVLCISSVWFNLDCWVPAYRNKTNVHKIGLPRYHQRWNHTLWGILLFGYIIGPKISGVLVAGSVLAWWAMIPLMATPCCFAWPYCHAVG